MQKKLLLIAVYFTITGACVNAQNKKQYPAPPPPPPAPPIENLAVVPPPPPPVPPAPPAVPAEPSPVIINSNGYDISIQKVNGDGMIFLEKDGVKQKIRLSTWNANRKFYEKKYGQLPPPPPAPPIPPTAPAMIPDTQ